MNARDELANLIASVTIDTTSGDVLRVHPDGETPVFEGDQKTADALIEAGYRKPRYLTDDDLYADDGDTALPDGTFVESADGSVWWVEPDFGWDCVTPGSATLSGPALLLVIGVGFDD